MSERRHSEIFRAASRSLCSSVALAVTVWAAWIRDCLASTNSTTISAPMVQTSTARNGNSATGLPL